MYDVTTAKLFLLDMDGTFYLDDTLLPGALEFLAPVSYTHLRAHET